MDRCKELCKKFSIALETLGICSAPLGPRSLVQAAQHHQCRLLGPP